MKSTETKNIITETIHLSKRKRKQVLKPTLHTVVTVPTLEQEDLHNEKSQDEITDIGLYTGWVDSGTNLPDGHGTMKYYAEGREYSGEWYQGKIHGNGTLTNKSGDTYQGNFAYNQKHGQGTLVFVDGRVFTGRFENNKMREGKLLNFAGRCYYKGAFEGNKRSGFGFQVFPDGVTFTGNWFGDKMHGKGRMEWPDGTSYEGDWNHGQPMFPKSIKTWMEGTTQPLTRRIKSRLNPYHLMKRMY